MDVRFCLEASKYTSTIGEDYTKPPNSNSNSQLIPPSWPRPFITDRDNTTQASKQEIKLIKERSSDQIREEMAESAGKKRVMVAIEEHECSHYALEWALLNLKATISSPLLLITVQPVAAFTYLAAASYSTPPPELIQSVQEHQKEEALGLLEKAKGICAKHGVEVETITEVGEPKEVICEVAEKRNVELLVLGNHGRGAVERFFLGSVSNYCVHHAKCPVLVVKQDTGKN